MAVALEFSGQVRDGQLPRAVLEQLQGVARQLDGKRIVVSIREQKRRRSNNQNSYLWGVVYPRIVAVFREAGNNVDAEDVHSYCKQHVGKLKQVFVTPDGEVLSGPGSTAKLDTMDFEVYLEKVRAWAAEVLDLKLPLPNEEINQSEERNQHG